MIWLPSKELQDLRSLLRHSHQWVRMRTRIQKQRQKKTPFVRQRRSVVEFASKEEKTLLTRPASLEIPR